MKLWFTVSLYCLGLLVSIGEARGEDNTPVATPDLGAVVLGKEIDLNQIVYREQLIENQKKLSPAEFETWLRKHQSDRLFETIKMRVMQDYVTREKISPSDEELTKLIQDTRLKYPESFEATDEEAKRKIGFEAAWVLGMTRDWRLARALHQKYGGRVATSSFGAFEAFEGRNAVLKEYVDRGDVKFTREYLKQAFFDKMKDERIQDVTLSPERSTELFLEPSPLEKWLAKQTEKNAEMKAARQTNPKPAPALPKSSLGPTSP